MNCPTCKNTALVMSERQGIEIDYCPSCRGVWLDRGELDKIVERSIQETPGMPSAAPTQTSWGHGHPRDSQRDHYRKKSIWQEIFD